MRSLFFFVIAICLSSPSAWAKQICDQKYGVWATESDGVRNVVYGSDGLAYHSNVYFEEWRQSKLAWRARATVTCSNGAVICYALVENASGLTGDDATTEVVVEEIDENADGLSDWVIFAALAQHLYYTGGAKVEWFNGFGPDGEERITIPNIFRFFGCRKAEELSFGEPVNAPGQLTFRPTNTVSGTTLARAFDAATENPTARMKAVLDGMNSFRSLESMVKDGRITSPYDCLPEHRLLCFDVLKEPQGNTVIEEWGEWRDSVPANEMPQFVEKLTQDAKRRGFDLLTADEIAAAN